MANTIANHLYVYGPRNYVAQFLAEFLRDGLDAHVPIPPDAEPSEDPATKLRSRWGQIHVDHWGAFGIDPEIYWTSGCAYGVSMLTKGQDRIFEPEQLQLSNVRKLDLNDKSESPWSPRPGFVPPSNEDTIAYFKFYSPWNPPFRWFGKVASDVYSSGLRLTMDSIDLSNIGQDGSHQVIEHWSVHGPCEFHQDGHWALAIRDVEGSDDRDDYDELPDVSAEMMFQSKRRD